MSLGFGNFSWCALLGGALCAIGSSVISAQTPNFSKRPVTVEDAVRIVNVAGSPYPAVHPERDFAVFSPDSKLFIIVVVKANVDKNTNEYSLLLFRSAEVSHGVKPKTLVTFSCSSNRAGISEVKWLGQEKILFLGSPGNDPAELYSLDLKSGKIRKLTRHPYSLLSYDVSHEGSKIVYAAEPPEQSIMNEKTSMWGFDVGSERPSELVRGLVSGREPEVYLKVRGRLPDRRLKTSGPFETGVNGLFLSPDGRYVAVKTISTHIQDGWRQYDSPAVRMAFRPNRAGDTLARVPRYELIDTETGMSRVLLDSPASFSTSDLLWAPDSASLILCGTYLPLGVKDPTELQARQTTQFAVELNVSTLKFSKITTERLTPLRWDRSTNVVEFDREESRNAGSEDDPLVYYQKSRKGWDRLPGPAIPLSGRRLKITVEEDMNHPPRVVSINPANGSESLVLNLNPGIEHLDLADEQEIHWSNSEGKVLDGGLYLPPGLEPGKKYPLVIQTHGFDAREFQMDGPYTTAFAAQPLAAQGIVVLQMNDIFFDTMETPEELDQVLTAYESAIDYLDSEGLIDPQRVGLVGFSRTCMYVKYALTHSGKHFAAAIASDGIDAGYLQYLLSYPSNPGTASDFEAVLGGPPFGPAMSLWLKNSPGFLLDKVGTPLLLEPIGANSVLGEWQWFAGLKRLRKPVDMLYLPGGTHILVRPWDRLTSEQATVDWFCFWLKGEQDQNPAKAGRYSHWRELRAKLDLSPVH